MADHTGTDVLLAKLIRVVGDLDLSHEAEEPLRDQVLLLQGFAGGLQFIIGGRTKVDNLLQGTQP